MRIAVQNPYFIMGNQERNYNGYNYVFLKEHVDVIYITDMSKILKFIGAMIRHDIRKKVCLSIKTLNKCADMLLCFNGQPEKKYNCPDKRFRGIKICHVMDFIFYSQLANNALLSANVDYLFTYSAHDKQSDFFKRYYKAYSNKTISIPFGFGKRFVNHISFEKRINKCIALGSVNPVNDPLCPKGMLDDYIAFYKDKVFTHYVRRAVVEHKKEWQDVFDDCLPVYPKTKNPNYDAVSELNKYTMFLNDAGLMQFPPARTYEGIACGAVMVAEDLPCFREMGFLDGKNSILFTPGNFEEMVARIRYYQEHFNELKLLQQASLKLAKNYTHKKVASQLYVQLNHLEKLRK